jgi:hypothetical protein
MITQELFLATAIALLLSSPAGAVDPDTLTREDKALYLKCAHALGGGSNSIVFMGSINLSKWSREELQLCIEPPPALAVAAVPAMQATPVKTVAVPVDPPPARLADRADVCRRHGMRKVITGNSWRCRR